jgi:2-dehydropantoate 2-reductase
MGKRILMMGAGAIGGYAGGWMAKAGEDVTFIDAWPAHVEAMRQGGLSLRGLTSQETTTVPVRALHICDVPQLVNEKPFDVIFIAVKSYDTEWATTMVKPLLAPDGFCVSLQNCINEERIAAIVGWGRTMGCIVSLLACELIEAGRVIRTVPMGGEKHTVFRVGEPHGRVTPRAQEVAQLMRHVDSAKVTNNLWGERWSKLVINSMRNGLSAATGMRGNERDLNEATRWLSIRLGSQCVRVGQALGFQLEKMLGMDPEMMGLAGEGNRDALADIVDRLVEGSKKRSDEQRPSMAQDIHKGRRTEIDYINGFVHEKGLEIGIAADLHLKLRDIVRKVESRSVPASPDLVAGL